VISSVALQSMHESCLLSVIMPVKVFIAGLHPGLLLWPLLAPACEAVTGAAVLCCALMAEKGAPLCMPVL
jgi:hypothetical protein